MGTRPNRRLSAILAADVVGYSRLMGQDEAGTLERLKALRREIVQPLIAKHAGRIVKIMGDGLLAEFLSVVEAVQCAIAMQEQTVVHEASLPKASRIELRMGINLGDIIREGSDIYGDGVNVAARLEAMADPGGLCISGAAYDAVEGKLDRQFEDMGLREVKNIARPVRVYCLKRKDSPPLRQSPSLPDKPSIAVLPFENMSGDRDQEYFADGMVEEIITALSRMRWLFVIARNSSFTYKGRAVDVKQVGRELGVRYVLEGSVRKAGNRMRITGQLIDAATGAHLWADRFDGDLEDVFDLQDQVTASVVGALGLKLEQAEIERTKRKPTDSLDAYDYYLRGMAAFHLFSLEGNREALQYFYKAAETDPNFASAIGMAARCYAQRTGFGWVADRAWEKAEALRLARRASELGKDDAIALAMAGFALVIVVGELEDGGDLIDRALALNPNFAWAWMFSGWAKVLIGEPEAAIQRLARAMRLSPQDPQIFGMESATGFAHFFAGRDNEALSWAERALRAQPNFFMASCLAAASAALLGKNGEADKAMARLRELKGTFRLDDARDMFTFRRSEDVDKFARGLALAGLPD
jgi:TolB-like protein/class 3 adenylate cyclase